MRTTPGWAPWVARIAPLLLLAWLPQGGVRAQAPPRLAGALEDGGDDFVLTLGPIDLPAGATHHQVVQPRPQEVAVPGDGWLKGFRLEFVDRSGRPVPQTVLHHLNLIMPQRRELFSPIMLRIAAAGHETGPVRLPWLMGVKVRKGERILVTAMFTNEASRRAYQGVQLRVHMPYTAAGTWLPPMSVSPFYLDVMPPAGSHEYDLPPGRSQRSWDAHPAIAVRLLGVGGHLHRYGTLLRFEDVTAGKVIWDARPLLGAGGEVVGMPTGKFWWAGGVRMDPAHVYRLTAFYDNPTGRTIPGGAMGSIGGVLVPTGGTVWPAVNPTDPEYRKDVQVTSAGMSMTMPMAPVGPGMPTATSRTAPGPAGARGTPALPRR